MLNGPRRKLRTNLPQALTPLFVALLLLAAAEPAAAHSFLLVDEQGNAMPINPQPGRAVAVDLTGAQAVIRVMNSGDETDGCITTVTATVGGNSVSFAGGATAFTGVYVTPPVDHLDVKVGPTGKTGESRVSVRWSASRGTCSGSGAALFDFNVEGGKLRLTSYEGENSYSFGDPVSLATGELHGSNRLRADLFLGGPLPLSFARYYGAFLAVNSIGGALGDNWMHNFDFSLSVAADAATVTLFGGKTISFQREGDSWTLSSAEKLDHQLIDVAGGGFRFFDLSTTRIYTFDAQGLLTAIEDRNGNALTITQGADGPAAVRDGLGRSLTLAYAEGKITRVADQTGRAVTYAYAADNLTGVTRANGAVTTYSYTAQGDLAGLIETTTLPDGTQPATQTYNADGQVVSQTDGTGNVTRFQYDQLPSDEESQVIDPRGQIAGFVHPGGQNLSSTTDAAGFSDSAAYDEKNRIVSYMDRLGNEATFSYHEPSGFLSGVTDFSGAAWTMEYQQGEQGGFRVYSPARRVFPDSSVELFEYDGRGNLTKFTGRAGAVRAFTYNERGRLLTMTNPLGGTARFTPNDDGSLAEAVSAGGVTRRFTYDTLKRLNTIQHNDGTVRTLQIDPSDNITQVTDEAGRSTQIGYDDNGRVVSLTDPAGASRRFEYDANNRLARFTDRVGTVRTIRYDAAGHLAEVRNGAGEATSLTYDGRNLLTSIADGVGTSVNYGYDSNGRATSVTDALGKTGSLSLERMGRVLKMTAPNGADTNFTYDLMGRLTSIRSPVGVSRQFGYDPAGRVSGVTVGGIASGYQFNGLGRLTSLTDPNGNAWMRGYDAAGRQTSRTDPLGRVIQYSYDQLGRRNEIQTPLGLNRRTFTPTGHISRAEFFDGTAYDFSHDENDRFLATSGAALRRDAEGRIIDSNGILIEYDAAGRIAKITYGPRMEVTYTYDARGRLRELTDWASSAATRFTYDSADRRIRIERPNGVTTEFTYDDNDALTGVRHTGAQASAQVALVRDEAGRITSATVDAPLAAAPAPGVQAATYDATHQIADGTYDDLGRLLADRLRHYVWDGNSNLTSYSGADGSASFTYDGLGNRISRTTSAGTENYVLNHVHRLPMVSIVRSGGADRRYYIYQPDGRLLHSIEAGGSRRFYHFDHAGSTMMLTDDTGVVTDSYAAGPFGEDVRHQGGSDQPFVFHGAFGVMWEPGTSLYVMGRRYYDAASARFLSRDPVQILDPLGVNPYQFAFNQPLYFADPSGLSPGSFTDPSTGPGVSGINPLWGDYQFLDLGQDPVSPGFPLVQIEASGNPILSGGGLDRTSDANTGYTFYGRYVQVGGGGDNRDPLAGLGATSYVNGGAFGGTDRQILWDPTVFAVDWLDPTRQNGTPENTGTVPEWDDDDLEDDDDDDDESLTSDGRFRVTVNWADFERSNIPIDVGPGPLFFSPDNWELLVKVLDGVSINNGFWVFSAATTDVEYTLTTTVRLKVE